MTTVYGQQRQIHRFKKRSRDKETYIFVSGNVFHKAGKPRNK